MAVTVDHACTSACSFFGVKPKATTDVALELATKYFQLIAYNIINIEELDGYDDRNFLITYNAKETSEQASPKDVILQDLNKRYIFKIYGTIFSKNYLNAVRKLLMHLNENCQELEFPLPQRPRNGNYYEEITMCSSCGKYLENNLDRTMMSGICTCGGKLHKHAIGMMIYIAGSTIASYADALSGELLWNLGKYTAKVDKCLQTISLKTLSCPDTSFDMGCLHLLRPLMTAIKGKEKSSILTNIIDRFEQDVIENIDNLPRQPIHGDVNEGNVLLNSNGIEETSKYKITAFIDFGDCTTSCRVFEVSIAMAYISLICPKWPIESSGEIIAGYLSEVELDKEEIRVVYTCVLGRICQSLINGAYRYEHIEPNNESLLQSAKTGWKVLETLLGEFEVLRIWDSICLNRLGKVYFQK